MYINLIAMTDNPSGKNWYANPKVCKFIIKLQNII